MTAETEKFRAQNVYDLSIQKGDKVLLTNRPDYKGYLGYNILGGKNEFSESTAEAAMG